MKKFLIAVLLLVIVTKSEAGFRCTVGGDTGCSAGCVVLGQTSGTCDDDGECWCSERSIDFNALLPSRCHLGRAFCEGTCNAIGRRTGECRTVNNSLDCQCSDEKLTPKQFALCAAESTCRLDCQAKGKATGECRGWNCKCQSTNDIQNSEYWNLTKILKKTDTWLWISLHLLVQCPCPVVYLSVSASICLLLI